jgi:hypothetical protein
VAGPGDAGFELGMGRCEASNWETKTKGKNGFEPKMGCEVVHYGTHSKGMARETGRKVKDRKIKHYITLSSERRLTESS